MCNKTDKGKSRLEQIEILIDKMHLYSSKGESIARTIFYFMGWFACIKSAMDALSSNEMVVYTHFAVTLILYSVPMIIDNVVYLSNTKGYSKKILQTIIVIISFLTCVFAFQILIMETIDECLKFIIEYGNYIILYMIAIDALTHLFLDGISDDVRYSPEKNII